MQIGDDKRVLVQDVSSSSRIDLDPLSDPVASAAHVRSNRLPR
jgi:hypothetical protein